MQSFCHKCGRTLTPGKKFCAGCGTVVTATPAAPVQAAPIVAEPRCTSCGRTLTPGKKFCAGCGTAVAAAPTAPVQAAPIVAEPRCTSCDRTLTPGKKFCAGCGTAVAAAPVAAGRGTMAEKPPAPGVVAAAAAPEPLAQLLAPAGGGAFTMDIPDGFAVLKKAASAAGAGLGAVTESLSPIKVLLDGVKGFFKGIGGAFKSPKALLTALVMGIIWVVLTLLPALDIEPPAFLNWLTFAQAGLTGGISGLIGGVLGKGLLASTLVGLLSRVGRKGGVKAPKSAEKGGMGAALLGVGLALIAYNFLTCDNSPQNSMAGIVGCVAALRSGKAGGFLNKLLAAFASKLTQGKSAQAVAASVSKGMATGFALGVPLSLAEIGGIGYILGAFVCAAGLVLSFAGNSRKGAVA